MQIESRIPRLATFFYSVNVISDAVEQLQQCGELTNVPMCYEAKLRHERCPHHLLSTAT